MTTIYSSPLPRVSHGSRSCCFSLPKEGAVNIITDFNPIDSLLFIAEISDCKSVDFIRSIQRYSVNEGGVNLQLKPGFQLEHLVMDVKSCLIELESNG